LPLDKPVPWQRDEHSMMEFKKNALLETCKYCMSCPLRSPSTGKLYFLSMMVIMLSLPHAAAAAAEMDECIAKRLLKAKPDTLIEDIRADCQTQDALMPEDQHLAACIRERGLTSGETVTVGEIRAECKSLLDSGKHIPRKFLASRAAESNPYIILPLRQNYILPYTYNNKPNQSPYQISGENDLMENEEAKLQLSIKVPLTFTDLLTANDGLYFGFTLKSFWQVYNDDISAPFRETNYRPEFFYQTHLPVTIGEGAWYGRLGFEHESNGRTQLLSRSWNRVNMAAGYLQDDWSVMLQPWYRLPEDKKHDDGDPETPPEANGDDNPDIEDYMGHYELSGAYRLHRVEFTSLLRRNFDTGKGAVEIGVSFPLWGRLRGYAQYFDGYGESMIDYNHSNQRIGIGALLTDML